MRSQIRTERLVLDPLSDRDVNPLHEHWSEPEVREFLFDGRAPSKQEVRDMVTTSDAIFGSEGAGLWAIRSPEQAFLGCVGYWYFHEPPERELIVSLSPGEWGKGMASEACRAMIGHAFHQLGWASVQASADSPNQRSLSMIRALGMRPTGARPGEFGSIDVFCVSREEWV